MNILKKKNQVNNETEAQNNKELTKKEEFNHITYTQLVSHELNDKMTELKDKKKRIENAIQSALEEIKLRGNDGNGLAQIVSDLREKEKNISTEIEHTSVKYSVDPCLLSMAYELDNASSHNKAVEVIRGIAYKINEIIPMLQEVKKCYGSEYYAPSAYAVIKRAIEGLVMSLNNELPKLHKTDKENLLKRFNERMAEIEINKRKIQENIEKYNIL